MKRCLILTAAVLFLAISTVVAEDPVLDTDEKKILYSMGQALSRNLQNFALTTDELAVLQAGLADGVLGNDPKVALETYGPKIDQFLQGKIATLAETEKKAGTEFTDKIATEPGAVKTDSGMVYFEIAAGTGTAPTVTDKVKVHYKGSLRDGSVFDQSAPENPVEFGLNAVIPCFRDGIQMMKVGGKSKLVCPPDIAYGDAGRPPVIPGGATLVFEIELLGITGEPETTEPPQSPAE